jgi:hypothetical protein
VTISDSVIDTGVMEISLLKALLNNISSFFHLSSCENINSEPVLKYYQRAEEILKLLKPILDVIVDSEIASDEVVIKAFEELSQSVEELRELFENCQPLSSKVYFVSYNIQFNNQLFVVNLMALYFDHQFKENELK